MQRLIIVMSFLSAFVLSVAGITMAYEKEIKWISSAITENIAATAM